MTDQPTRRRSIEIKLHAKSRVLGIAVDDGAAFELPCEYLRVFSRAAEVRTLDQPPTGKEGIDISAIEPQGRYAARIVFDDDHEAGIYSPDTLYRLGKGYAHNRPDDLARPEQFGYSREEPGAGEKRLFILYIAWLAGTCAGSRRRCACPRTSSTFARCSAGLAPANPVPPSCSSPIVSK